MPFKKVEFENSEGYKLDARIELPVDGQPHSYALFAHVFTGNKSLSAVRHISRGLTVNGIAVLRFDFTGLGESEGDFADTNFTSNVEDLVAAGAFLEEHYEAPKIIVGHSLGGAASIFAAHKIPSIQAIATIGAPSEPVHVSHLLEESIEKIEKLGKARVNIGGRVFTIKKQFLEDLQNKNMFEKLKENRKPLLVLHSPQDTIVEIENAAKIYHAAHHPKSFVTLDGADHMLTSKKDAKYVGDLIAHWAQRYIDIPKRETFHTERQVAARLGEVKYTTEIVAGRHGLLADESEEVGGDDFGPSPYQYLSAALSACTAMTLQMYARRKKWDLKEVRVHIDHGKRYKDDCENCEDAGSKLDHFDRHIELIGDLDAAQQTRLLEIADRCPVHRTLHKEIIINTSATAKAEAEA